MLTILKSVAFWISAVVKIMHQLHTDFLVQRSHTVLKRTVLHKHVYLIVEGMINRRKQLLRQTMSAFEPSLANA